MAQIKINDIFQIALTCHSHQLIFGAMNEVIGKTHLNIHDFEDQIGKETENMEDSEEPVPSSLDVQATFHLKMGKADGVNFALPSNGYQTTRTYKGPSSIISISKKFETKGMKYLQDKGEDIVARPLYSRGDEEDQQTQYYRKLKDKQARLKEEERLKYENIMQQLKDAEERGNKEQDKQMAKKLITYDTKGDIIFIKTVKADGLPNPILNPPYKVKEIKSKVMPSVNASQVEITTSENGKKKVTTMDMIRKPKVTLLADLDPDIAPIIKNEVTPMGSTFADTDPMQGVVLMEQGKVKYGTQNLSMKDRGQMSLEEYRVQKEQTILVHEQIEQTKQNKKNSSSQTQPGSVSRETIQELKQQNSLSRVLPPANQTQGNFYISLNATKSIDFNLTNQYNNSQSALTSASGGHHGKSQDRLIIKKMDIAQDLFTEKSLMPKLNLEYTENQNSYVESLQQSFRNPFDRKASQTQGDLSQLFPSSNKMKNSISSVRLQPLAALSRRSSAVSGTIIEEEATIQNFRNKNRQIINDNNWGINPNGVTSTKRIEKKPTFLELRKSSSQASLNKPKMKHRERHFIESVKERQHLPPPPVGKTIGHGVGYASSLNQSAFNNSMMNATLNQRFISKIL